MRKIKRQLITRVLWSLACLGLGIICSFGFFWVTQGDLPQGYVTKGIQLLEVTEKIRKGDFALEARERHIYNANNPDKNLLLQFLNDEIPIMNYPYFNDGKEDKKYYIYLSDIEERFCKVEDSFYIIDMDGDGKNEFCFIIHPCINIIKYNEETGCFELWLEEREQQIPVGDGKMYSLDHHTQTIWGYYVYGENANLIENIEYVAERFLDENSNVCFVYKIREENDMERVVSEKIWDQETRYLSELIENAPKPLSYQMLLEE